MSLSKDAFAHFGAGVNASVVFLRKRSKNDNLKCDIFMASPQFIGYDATGHKTAQNQLKEIAQNYEKYISGIELSQSQETGYLVSYDSIDGRIDVDHYAPQFIELKRKIESSEYSVVTVESICKSIKSGFAAGKQDQADELPDDERIPHLRPFSITSNGELSLDTKKYVPLNRLKAEDFCKKGEVLFNNTNSIDLVGKTAVFDIDTPCATSNHITRLTLNDCANPHYVAAFFNLLLSLGYWKYLATNFNNQSGINNETLKKVKIILPPIEIQTTIADELVAHYSKAMDLRKEAEEEIYTGQKEFEKELLGE